MRNKTSLILLTVIALILCLIGYYLYLNTEIREVTIPPAPTEKVTSDKFYSAEQLLSKLGYPARQIVSINEILHLPTNNTLVLSNTDYIDARDKQLNAKLISWIKRGGHLLIGLNDNDSSKYRRKEASPLLTALGISPKEIYQRPCGCEEKTTNKKTKKDEEFDLIQTDGEPLRANIKNEAVTFELKKSPEWQTQLLMNEQKQSDDDANDDESDSPKETKAVLKPYTVVARFKLGNGWVTVADINIFGNYEIKQYQHAALLVRLATLPEAKRPVLFIKPTEETDLFGWLYANAQQALLALLALIIAVLWHFMPRFGSLLPAISSNRLGLITHLLAVGNFYLRQSDYTSLLSPLREEVNRELAPLCVLHPEITNMPLLAAKITKMPQTEVINAMLQNPQDNTQFLKKARILSALINGLRKINPNS